MPGTTPSLRAGVDSSSLRLAIVLRKRSKDGGGLLRTTHATGAIIPRPSVRERTQRVTARAASTQKLSCRSAMASSTEAGPSSG